jgi:LPS export ABC transporter permease LptG/LPS export ABC transporter permease LptF
MRILTRYIVKETIGPTLLGFGFYTFIIIMRVLFDLAGMIIGKSLPAAVVGRLLLLSLPHVVVLTVPMGLLFGILIAVGRLSSDSEIIAMRALGLSTSIIYRPIFYFSFVIFLVNLYLMNVVLPKGNTQLRTLQAEILTASVEKEIKPRTFFSDYESYMIYVNDVDPRTGQWKGVFVSEHSAEENNGDIASNNLSAGLAAAAEHPVSRTQRIIIARRGSLGIIPQTKQVWLNLIDAQTHVSETAKPEKYDLNRNATQRVMLPDRFSGGNAELRRVRQLRELTFRELLQQARVLSHTDRALYRLAKVEIHKKFTFPFACLALGLVGLPLGITNRRGGKSSGFSLSIGIILFYYLMMNNGEALAVAGKIGPALGMWTPNIVLVGLGIYLMIRANRDAGSQSSGGVMAWLGGAIRRLTPRSKAAESSPSGLPAVSAAKPAREGNSLLSRLDLTFPNTLDRYVLREFVKILTLVIASTAMLVMLVTYTEIAGDIRERHIPLGMVLEYFRLYFFQALGWTLPISVLVATLVTFGILAKNNEVTAFKANGVSLYRVAFPIVAVSLLMSGLSYLLNDFVLPYSTQRLQQIEDRIKGRHVAAISSPNQQKQWYRGRGNYIFNFLSYDPEQQELKEVQVFEFSPDFRLVRRVWARTAKWDGTGWAFRDGWMRSFDPDGTSSYSPFTAPLRLQYSETPADFASDTKSPDQMTYGQLKRYITTLKASGYSAEELSVKLYEKASWPFVSLVMALIALPFAFRVGKRGALYGVGVALVLGIVYWLVFAVFTKFGEVGNLPPLLAAWSANILFSLSAVYMFLHVDT